MHIVSLYGPCHRFSLRFPRLLDLQDHDTHGRISYSFPESLADSTLVGCFPPPTLNWAQKLTLPGIIAFFARVKRRDLNLVFRNWIPFLRLPGLLAKCLYWFLIYRKNQITCLAILLSLHDLCSIFFYFFFACFLLSFTFSPCLFLMVIPLDLELKIW
jgi:hypothetical protein